jgi:hypothetical protein
MADIEIIGQYNDYDQDDDPDQRSADISKGIREQSDSNPGFNLINATGYASNVREYPGNPLQPKIMK